MMQPVPVLVAALLGLAALAYVLFPLYRRATPLTEPPTSAPHLSEREQNARQALHEVEFDFQLGNLDESEYRTLRTRYMGRAIFEMKERQQQEEEIDARIEEALRTLKETKQHDEG